MNLVTTLAVVCLTAAGETLERPPKLTFESHVDYTAYYRTMVERPGEPNARDEYIKLLDENGNPRIVEPEITTQLWADINNYPRGGPVWTEKQKPELDQYVRENRQLLEIFKRGCQVQRYWKPLQPGAKRLSEDLRTPGSATRRLQRVILIDAWRETDDQVGRLLDSSLLLLHYSAQFKNAGTLIDQLIGQSNENDVVRNLLTALTRGVIQKRRESDRVLRALTERLAPSLDIEKALLLEWASALDYLQFICPGGKADESLIETEKQKLGTLAWFESPDVDAAKQAESIDRVFEGMIKASRLPYYSRERIDLRRATDTESSHEGDGPATSLRSAYTRAINLVDEVIARRRGVLLALAINAHQESRGAWPRRLRDLKNIDAAYRIDPFSGKEFRYELRAGEPFLYSIGTDCKDDGGTPDMLWAGSANEGDWVFWPAALPYQFKVKSEDVNEDEDV